MTNKKDISIGCNEWRSQIRLILDLPPEDEIRQVWTKHAQNCPECQSVITDDNQLRCLIQTLPDPGAAFIAPRVREHIHSTQSNRAFFNKRAAAWTIAGTVAGIVMGILLSSFNINDFLIKSQNETNLYAEEFQQLNGGLDYFLEVWNEAVEETP